MFFLGTCIYVSLAAVHASGRIDFSIANEAVSKIENVSIQKKTWTTQEQLEAFSWSIFSTIKVLLQGILVIYLVYFWVLMMISLGNEERLWKAKRGIWYAAIGVAFINVPGSLFDVFWWWSNKKLDATTTGFTSKVDSSIQNIFFDYSKFWDILGNVLTFLQVLIISFAVILIVISAIELMLAFTHGSEKFKQLKDRIIYSLLVLIFMTIIPVWKEIMFTGNFHTEGANLFSKLANLALLFAWPVALFFLSLAWWYFITAAGNESQISRAKNIVVNTVLATLILLGMYTFFGDLGTQLWELGTSTSR